MEYIEMERRLFAITKVTQSLHESSSFSYVVYCFRRSPEFRTFSSFYLELSRTQEQHEQGSFENLKAFISNGCS